MAETLYNTLMWSHYTNGHQGVVLQFSTQQIKAAISSIGIIKKVKYQNVFPEINPYEPDEFKQLQGIIFRKSERWLYENEVRIVLPEINSRILKLPKMPVRNIYLGCKINAEDEAELMQAFQDRPNKIYRLQMSKTKFAYRRRPIY